LLLTIATIDRLMNMLRSSFLLCLALLAPLDAFVPSRARFAIIQASPLRVSQQEIYSTSISNSDDGKTEYAAIFPGSEVRIQVGNVELARKAWKKRRRSGSPVLIPCSVLDLDRTTLVVDNIVYLIQKFGTPMSESKLELLPEGYKGKDICLSMSELNQNYRKHLGSSLAVSLCQAFLLKVIEISILRLTFSHTVRHSCRNKPLPLALKHLEISWSPS
jgi:hypothetical protein